MGLLRKLQGRRELSGQRDLHGKLGSAGVGGLGGSTDSMNVSKPVLRMNWLQQKELKANTTGIPWEKSCRSVVHTGGNPKMIQQKKG